MSRIRLLGYDPETVVFAGWNRWTDRQRRRCRPRVGVWKPRRI